MVRRPFSRPYRRAKTAREGAAAVEFALVGPILVFLLIGIVVYGGWFLMAQSVQALASEGARAAVGGLDSTERESLARTEVADAVKGLPLNPSLTTVRIAEDGGRLRIVVTYDASRHPLMLLGGMIPRPPAVIERSAVVRVGQE